MSETAVPSESHMSCIEIYHRRGFSVPGQLTDTFAPMTLYEDNLLPRFAAEFLLFFSVCLLKLTADKPGLAF
jgi:hypothetical protein